MLWFGKKKSGGKKPTSGNDREALKAQAMENVRKARAEIGQENLDKMVAVLQKQGFGGPPKTEKQIAEEKIRSLDRERLADNLRAMMDDKDN